MLQKSKSKWMICLTFLTFLGISAMGQTKEGSVRVETSAHIDEMLAQKKEYNKSIDSFDGYKIQIYYGTEKKCYEVKEEFDLLFPDTETIIIFSTPQWKLQVGNYKTRLEADHAIVNIKKEYPAAIVLASEIEIK